MIYGPRDEKYNIVLKNEPSDRIKNILGKYFGPNITYKIKNSNKNFYLKSELKALIDKTNDSEKDKKDLLKKAYKLVDFKKTSGMSTVELLGAEIKENDKEEFLETMMKLESLGVKFKHFIPMEMPRLKKSDETVKEYEKYLEKCYKKVRPKLYDRKDPDNYIYDPETGIRKPYPHEMFKWDADNMPSIDPNNKEGYYYLYYLNEGKRSKEGRREVTRVENITKKPGLLRRLHEKLISKNDILLALNEYNEQSRDSSVSIARYKSFTDRLKVATIAAGGVTIISAIAGSPLFVPAVVGGTGLLVASDILLIARDTYRNYVNIKNSKVQVYYDALTRLESEIERLKNILDSETDGYTMDTERKRALINNLKNLMGSYLKTQILFNKAYNKASKQMVQEYAERQRNLNDFKNLIKGQYMDEVEAEERKL